MAVDQLSRCQLTLRYRGKGIYATFQTLTNLPVVSGLVPRWAAQQPQNQPLQSV